MSDTESEFEGFTQAEALEAESRLQELIGEQSDDSDIEFSDHSDSDDEIPLAQLQQRADVDSDDEPNNGDQWTEELTPIAINEFKGHIPGPVTEMTAEKNEKDFFELIFTRDWYGKIAEETNNYAAMRQRETPDPKWRRTNWEEIRAYLAFIICMGIISAPDQDLYWTTDEFFRGTSIAERISRDRFDKLTQYFHVADVTNNPPRRSPGHDKLAHVRPFLNAISSNVNKEYYPHKEQTVDEAMIGFTGRLGFKQYIPLKPTKRGIKVWVRADPHNGYITKLQVYTGRNEGSAEKNLGERVVKDMTEDLYGNFHHIYCDNYFSSVDLFEHLKANDTYACGTIRKHRKRIPKEVSQANLKEQGKSVLRQNGNLVASAWKDKRMVHILSTNFNPLDTSVAQRKQKDGTVKDVPCPAVIKMYNQFMNGVDRADQLRSAYQIGRKSSKWWKYLFFYLVDVAITCAFVLMKESPNHILRTRARRGRESRIRVRTQLEFRMKLVKQLVGSYWYKRKRETVYKKDVTGLLHWPANLEKRKTCKQCAKNKIRSEPKSGCEQCKVNLCVACFKPYHKDNFPELFQ